MSGYIKCFDDGGKNMSFKIEYESVYLEYNEIWNKIKKALNIRLHSQPIYDEQYIKTKFNGVINILFSGNKIRKEGNRYICNVLIQQYLLILLERRQEKLSSGLS